jgi:hypothetical protein
MTGAILENTALKITEMAWVDIDQETYLNSKN